MHDYFHPTFHDFIRSRFGPDDELIFVPSHYGCGLKNKSGANKLIDYRNGERCYSPAWTSGKEDIENNCVSFPLTRYMSFYGNGTFFKNKGLEIFNYKTNRFDHLLDTPNRENFSSLRIFTWRAIENRYVSNVQQLSRTRNQTPIIEHYGSRRQATYKLNLRWDKGSFLPIYNYALFNLNIYCK